MEKQTIYFLFTDTGSQLSRLINFATGETLNHVSICFDHELKEVYSFGRKSPKNPFIGGFVKEDIQSDFLRNADCAIYSFHISKAECEQVLKNIKEIEVKKSHYRYNFIGLFGVLLQVEIHRKYALFCSQFVATVMKDTASFKVLKPACFVTPGDIRNLDGMCLIYKGKLGNYQPSGISKNEITEQDKSSLFFLLTQKVKRLVAR